ncbi:MAG: hypothetical protein ACRDT4_01570 [Micromonosporaceae bacterium]
MKIDMNVEPRVREALAAIVKRDSGRLESAMRAFDETRSIAQGVELATAIVLVVLSDMFDHGPTRDELRGLAGAIAELEQWARPEPAEVEQYLVGVVDGSPLHDTLATDQIIVLSFLVPASLLAGRTKAEDGNRWFDYLDRVEARIEAAPDVAGTA